MYSRQQRVSTHTRTGHAREFEQLRAAGDPSIKMMEHQLQPYVKNLWIPRDLAAYEAAVTRLMDEFGDRVINPVGGRLAPPAPPNKASYIGADYLVNERLFKLAHRIFASLDDANDRTVSRSHARRVAHWLGSRPRGDRILTRRSRPDRPPGDPTPSSML